MGSIPASRTIANGPPVGLHVFLRQQALVGGCQLRADATHSSNCMIPRPLCCRTRWFSAVSERFDLVPVLGCARLKSSRCSSDAPRSQGNQRPGMMGRVVQVGRCSAGDVERAMGIEPTLSAWEAEVLPLNYARVDRILAAPINPAPLAVIRLSSFSINCA